jgi:hypothetical protein
MGAAVPTNVRLTVNTTLRSCRRRKSNLPVRRSLLVLILLLSIFVVAQRSPAPIVEEERPTPATAQSAKPKPKRVSKPKAANEKGQSVVTSQKHTATQARMPIQNRFDGTWIGTLNNLPFAGNVEFTLVVTGNGTSVIEKSANFGTNTFQVNCDGSMMRWETGSSWTLTPLGDGQTGLVTCSNEGLFGVGAFSLSTVFRKAGVTQTTVAISTQTSNTAPVAKAVPDRPGFVYNPFDPTSKLLLDVRGKASGTKLIDPKSGKLFVVP